MKNLCNKTLAKMLVAAALVGAVASARADADPFSDITTAVSGASTVWTAIKVIVLGIAVFYVGYKLLKKVK